MRRQSSNEMMDKELAGIQKNIRSLEKALRRGDIVEDESGKPSTPEEILSDIATLGAREGAIIRSRALLDQQQAEDARRRPVIESQIADVKAQLKKAEKDLTSAASPAT
jgi:hypothetical protein